MVSIQKKKKKSLLKVKPLAQGYGLSLDRAVSSTSQLV